MTLPCVPPTQLVLEIPAAIQEESWQQSQLCSTPQGCWTAYLNQMCLKTLLPWLQEEIPEAAIWLNGGAIASGWDVVNGSAITIATQRLVLIPDKSLEADELRVPQEWIDTPRWAGDYYLAVQVNPEGDWLRVWGYTTHEQLKTQGHYDADDRTYCLNATQLVDDLNALWVVRQLNPNEPTRAAIAPLVAVPDVQAENLLQRLGNAAIREPRLVLPSDLWGALLEREDWLPQLVRLRQGESPAEQPAVANVNLLPINLSQWFQQVFDETWQAIETLVNPDSPLAFNVRKAQAPTETLIRRVKQVRVQTQTVDQRLLLVLTLGEETDGRIGVQVQLYPVEGDRLPVTLRLAMLSATRTVVQSVQAREQDEYIQLKRFKCAPGTQFELQIVLNEFCFREEFVS